jgi:hypothetical protein
VQHVHYEHTLHWLARDKKIWPPGAVVQAEQNVTIRSVGNETKAVMHDMYDDKQHQHKEKEITFILTARCGL